MSDWAACPAALCILLIFIRAWWSKVEHGLLKPPAKLAQRRRGKDLGLGSSYVRMDLVFQWGPCIDVPGNYFSHAATAMFWWNCGREKKNKWSHSSYKSEKIFTGSYLMPGDDKTPTVEERKWGKMTCRMSDTKQKKKTQTRLKANSTGRLFQKQIKVRNKKILHLFHGNKNN